MEYEKNDKNSKLGSAVLNQSQSSVIPINDSNISTIDLVEKSHYQEVSNEKIANESHKVHSEGIENGTSDVGAFIHVVKSSLGTGILAIPYGFKEVGLVLGSVGLIFVAVICTHCVSLIVKCSEELRSIVKKDDLTYAETAEAVFQYGAGKRLKRYAPIARKSVEFFQFVTYFGSVSIYIIIVATSCREVISHQLNVGFNIRWYMLALLIPLLLIGLIRNLKYLVPFTATGYVAILAGMLITLYYAVSDLPPISSRKYVGDVKGIPIFFCITLFAMECVGMILPIKNSMKNPSHVISYRFMPGILNIAMTLVAISYLIMGFFGYLRFGEETASSITFNLPHDGFSEAIKLLVALSVLFSYSLQFTAAMEVVWENVKHKFSKSNEERGYYAVKGLLILGTVITAILIPNLSPVISLVGSIGLTGMGTSLPAIMETVLYWDKGLGLWKLWKNIFLIIISIVILISGTIIGVEDVIKEYVN